MSYTRLHVVDCIFLMTLTLTGLYTAQGDSKTPFLANLIGLVTNMILDPVLILGPGPFPKLGVTGAAIATVTAQAIVMSIMALAVIIRKKENVLKGIHLLAKIPREYLGGICRIGIPTAVQGMAYCAISMVLTRMVSGYGAEAVATQRVGGQIESISWNTADGFAAALNAFIAQNYGAGKMDRVKKGYRASLWTVGIWGILITLAFVCFPRPIAEIFFHEPKAITTAVGYLIIIGFSEAFMCVELTTVGALSGLGRTKLCSIISITFTSARIPLAIILGGLWDSVESGGLSLQHRLSKESYSPVHFSGSPGREDKAYENRLKKIFKIVGIILGIIILALIGGSIGAMIGMTVFHHKTRKWYFRLGIPLILGIQVSLILCFYDMM